MNEVKRRGLIVKVYSLRNLTGLKRFGHIYYTSKRMHYVAMYVNDEQIESVMEKINKLHFVRSVEMSYLPDIDMTFEHALEKSLEKTEELA
ncbi:DUF2129 domain-containing protein [Granulicatella sp. zg-ZJ]|uniref:YlbG family protein n=1 Tax=unclassified Granulicatella TaxID=2630493 RepID=UPI0013C0E20C|nr:MULTISPECIES: YlbG family protein [unclassified Granulicatella]MBS4749627.1 YlbG family protein [Carnobacteriaceae bacterium zg-ZUI78]NEW62401.1 DUF2129 domain-containing protein [Granulicatella sp. zg-ZJ]NEW66350.1 DUF2129 domain-containing protein [Granulicatella sp. zg-84]QMI86475.1 YlbG family protein [Carnobacteriaceae bacterium zg-84]